MTYQSIRPGQEWLDNDGERIHAHGGSIHLDGATFYWYGENKERTVPGSGIWHWGVRCYSSTDLYNWQDLGLIIPPDVDAPDSPLHPAQKMDRPHIIFNPATKKYVCWLKIMGEGEVQSSTVLTSDSFLGPYQVVRSWLLPHGMSAGDFDLTVNPADGRGYYYFERVHSALICADLTDDFTDVGDEYSTHFPHPSPPSVREAPAYFQRNQKHFLITSSTTGYVPNQSEVAVADAYHGPWTVLGDPHPGSASRSSFCSQISSVFRHPEKKDLFIAMADRWLPELSDEIIDRVRQGEPLDSLVNDINTLVFDPNTSLADYVWLPLRFEGDMPTIDWREEWRIEEFR